MGRQIVQDYDIARPKSRSQLSLDVSFKNAPVHRRVNDKGGGQGVASQAGDERLRLAVSERDFRKQPLRLLDVGPIMLAGPQSFMEWPAPPSGVVGSPANQEEEGMDISVLGIDLGKNVCSVVGLDASGAVVMRRKVRRETLIALAEKLPPCVVGMEACCGAHHLGRVFAAHGHDVRLMSPEYVRPYIKAQKNDDRDAEGIAEATTRPTMRAPYFIVLARYARGCGGH